MKKSREKENVKEKTFIKSTVIKNMDVKRD